MISLRRLGTPKTVIKNSAIQICRQATPFPQHVCSGVINLNIDIMLYIIDHRRELKADTVCAIIFQGDCKVKDNRFEWSIDIDYTNQTPITGSKSVIPPSASANDLTIVHISDTHYDPHYREGMNAECGEPACCRLKQGAPTNPAHAAGKWGDYRDCDSPWKAVLDVFMQIKDTHKV